MDNPRTAAQELHEFTVALAREGVREALVPLELFEAWARHGGVKEVKEDEHGPYIWRAGGAIIVRPLQTTASRTFENAEEVQRFIDVMRARL